MTYAPAAPAPAVQGQGLPESAAGAAGAYVISVLPRTLVDFGWGVEYKLNREPVQNGAQPGQSAGTIVIERRRSGIR